MKTKRCRPELACTDKLDNSILYTEEDVENALHEYSLFANKIFDSGRFLSVDDIKSWFEQNKKR